VKAQHKKKWRRNPPFLFYLIPNNLPSFDRLPLFVVGIPVAFAIFRFAFVTPNARFQLNERPGIPFFFAICNPPYVLYFGKNIIVP